MMNSENQQDKELVQMQIDLVRAKLRINHLHGQKNKQARQHLPSAGTVLSAV